MTQLNAKSSAPTPAPISSLAIPIAHTSRPAVRVRDPRMFDGTAKDVEPYIREVHSAISLNEPAFPTSRSKSLFLSMYLKDGSPVSWYRAVEQDKAHLLDDFPALISDFCKHFGDSDLSSTSLRKLQTLRQTGPASVHASRFRELLPYVSLSEDTKITLFYNGLKDDVKDLFVTVARENTLNKVIDQAITFDNRIHQRRQERRNDSGTSPIFTSSQPPAPAPLPSSTAPYTFAYPIPPSSTIAPAPAPAPFSHTPTSPAPIATVSEPVPMDVDALRIRALGRLTEAERQRRRDNNLCFYCGQGSHPMIDCPNMSAKAKQSLLQRRALAAAAQSLGAPPAPK